jgi:hypothetical protein
MRIRQIKPAFWTDARIAALPAAVRLFYIGLWMLADDAGYLRWDGVEAANELYGYETRRRREKHVAEYLAALVAAERVLVYDCGHVLIPHLIHHQHLAALTKRVLTFQREHQSCPRVPAEARGNPQVPAPVRLGSVGIGSVSLGSAARKRDDETMTEFEDRMAAAGYDRPSRS